VLLHALSVLQATEGWRLEAIHIQHGLHPQAGEWAERCRHFSNSLSVPFRTERIDIGETADTGLEAAARQARYRCMARLMGADDVLLTAHHLDDQAETVLLHLLRGAGVTGLSAMPVVTRFADGWHIRPLLGFHRADRLAYASAQALRWVEDSSNLDTRLGRNFLRLRVLPLLETRWPAASDMLVRAAHHAAEAAGQLSERSTRDLARCRLSDGSIDLSQMVTWPPARQRYVLREWIRQQGWPVPSAQAMERVAGQVTARTATGQARFQIGRYTVCRYGDRLYLTVPQPAERPEERHWPFPEALVLPDGSRLRATETIGSGLSRERLQGKHLSVGWRHGGEHCRLAGQVHSRPLKKLFQEAGVPPWERQRLPLVRVNGALAAIGDRWICEPFAAQAHEAGWMLRLEPPTAGVE